MLLNELIKQNFGTQNEAARALGVHQTRLSRVLTGRELPSENFKKKVRDFFALYFNETVEFIKDDIIIKDKDNFIKELKAENLQLKKQLKERDAIIIHYHVQLVKQRKSHMDAACDIETFDLDAILNNKEVK